MVGRAAKQSFKADWAKAEFDTWSKTHEKKRSWSHVDSTKGEWLPFGAIVQAEGGWEDRKAILAAETYARKCQQMGDPWQIHNEMTERANYLYIRKQYQNVFTQAWTEFQTQSSSGPVGSSEAPPAAEPKPKAKAAPRAPRSKAKPGEEGEEQNSGTPPKKQKTQSDIQKLIKSAQTWATKHHNVLSAAQHLQATCINCWMK